MAVSDAKHVVVQRSMSPDDRRVVLATITPVGRELVERVVHDLNVKILTN